MRTLFKMEYNNKPTNQLERTPLPLTSSWDAILLDLDGTLVDSIPPILEAFCDASRSVAGIDLEPNSLIPLLGMNDSDTLHAIREIAGNDFPYKMVRRAQRDLFVARVKKGGLRLKEGAKEFLEDLNASGTPSVVVTGSTRQEALLKMKMTNILDYVIFTVDGDAAKAGKPHPRLFLRACSLLSTLGHIPNPTSFDRVLSVGDHLNDVLAALKAGIPSLYIPDRTPQADAMDLANFHLPSLADYPRDT